VHSFAGDDFAACRDHVRQKLGFPPWTPRTQNPRTERPARPRSYSKPSVSTTTADALSFWRQGVDPRGTPAERYLAGRRLPLEADVAGEVIRWHPGVGAMLALFRDIRGNAPRAISRTFLDRDGRKLERKFLGPVGGSAVKLDTDDTVLECLHIGEGVETCLAARARPSPMPGARLEGRDLKLPGPLRSRGVDHSRRARRGARGRGLRPPLARCRARGSADARRRCQGRK
jgi:hypothetical protein